MATYSSTLAWKIPWAEEPGRLQSIGSRRVGHDWATSFSLSCIGEGNGNPLQCSCLENPRDREAWWAAVYGVAQSQTRLKRLGSSSSSCCCCFLNLPESDWFQTCTDCLTPRQHLQNISGPWAEGTKSRIEAIPLPKLQQPQCFQEININSIGEGNGNPLQCSCLENPRDGGAWWAAVYGVAQSQTRLKWLSSSSSYSPMPWWQNWAGAYS